MLWARSSSLSSRIDRTRTAWQSRARGWGEEDDASENDVLAAAWAESELEEEQGWDQWPQVSWIMFLREEWLVSRVFVSANFVLFRAGVVFGLVGMRLALELRLLAPQVGLSRVECLTV